MIRDLKGRFSKRKMGRGALLAIVAGCAAVPLASVAVESLGLGKEIVAINRVEAAEVVLSVEAGTVEKMKDDVLDRLAKCENPHGKPIVFDSNGVASVGSFQWQPHSFRYYWEKKTGGAISEKEAVILALDDEKARALASWVIFETDAGTGKDWVNCTKWHELDTLVEFIKAHE